MVNHYFCAGMSAGVEIKKQPGAGTKEKTLEMLPDCYHPSLRGPDSNGRPPGYEPGELPTAPPRDVIICECKGKAIF